MKLFLMRELLVKSRGDLQFAYEKLFIIHDMCQCVGVCLVGVNCVCLCVCVLERCVCACACTCSIYGLPAVIVCSIAHLQLPRQLIPYGTSTTVAAKARALEVAAMLLLEADHKTVSIDEQVTINRMR